VGTVKELTDDELLKQGREAIKQEHWIAAVDVYSQYCERMTERDLTVPAGVLASYGLALGHTRRLKEGLELCKKAVSFDRRSPHAYASLARLYLLAGSRKSAVETVARGLVYAPGHPVLSKLQTEVGVRRRPVFSFLPRSSSLNRSLGRLLHRLRGEVAGT
jgi:tetratricopeptide (TPR) repeat protein